MATGATREQWDAFAQLNLPDLVPIIADLSVQMAPTSEITAPTGKLVSRILPADHPDHPNMGIGIIGWNKPSYRCTSVHDWCDDPRLNIGMVCRRIKVIDIDVPDPDRAFEVEDLIRDHLAPIGEFLPLRSRSGESGKCALLYRLSGGPEFLKKNVVSVGGSNRVEFLGDKQQSVMAGRHPDGDYYIWPEGIPSSINEIPVVDFEQIVDLARLLQETYQDEDTPITPLNWTVQQIDRSTVSRSKLTKNPHHDYLVEHWQVKGYGQKGEIFVRCPWEEEHETPSKSDGSDTAFYPPGTNNQSTPGFRCLHAHCAHRTHVDFLEAIGYLGQETLDDFEEIEEVQPAAATRPRFTYKGRSQLIQATLPNLCAMLQWKEGLQHRIVYDQFKDALLWRKWPDGEWQPFRDDTYTYIRLRCTEIGMEPGIGREMIRDAVAYIGRENQIDSASAWLSELEWDGQRRIDTFHADCLRLPDTDYHHAVVRYLWTALAGRIMDPGIKADMVPILSGAQGLRKSTFAEYLAPSHDEFAVVSLADRDENLCRQLRGRMVLEWDELRGLHTRAMEAIKGWVTRRKDDWIPKFKEFAVSMPRRFILIGTTNETQVIEDPTGMRRWLPLFITEPVDTDYLEVWRDQLWAEARLLFEEEGVCWQDAERMAGGAQRKAAVADLWDSAVREWLSDGKEGFTALEALHQACSVSTAKAGRLQQLRIQRVLVRLGYEEDEEGRWHFALA